MARGRITDLPSFLEQNPMNWLAKKPSNYLNKLDQARVMALDAGNWCLDKKQKKSVYLFSHNENYRSSENYQLNFKVKLVNNLDSAVEHVGSSDLIKTAILVEGAT